MVYHKGESNPGVTDSSSYVHGLVAQSAAVPKTIAELGAGIYHLHNGGFQFLNPHFGMSQADYEKVNAGYQFGISFHNDPKSGFNQMRNAFGLDQPLARPRLVAPLFRRKGPLPRVSSPQHASDEYAPGLTLSEMYEVALRHAVAGTKNLTTVIQNTGLAAASAANQLFIYKLRPHADMGERAIGAQASGIAGEGRVYATQSVAPVSARFRHGGQHQSEIFPAVQYPTIAPQYGGASKANANFELHGSTPTEQWGERTKSNEQAGNSAMPFKQMIKEYYSSEVRLAPSGATGFDARVTPAWAGLKLPA